MPMLVVVLALAAVASGSSLRREESPSPQYQAARLDAAWRAAGSSFCQAVSKFAVDLLQFLDLEATLPVSVPATVPRSWRLLHRTHALLRSEGFT